MSSIFDEIIERRNTDSLKYDFAEKRGRPKDILPLWVADMDFRTPSFVIDALVEKSRHGIFGYSDGREEYFESLRGWFFRRHGWEVSSKWLIKTPGVVFAFHAAVRALTDEGDAVLIQQPNYYPFSEAVLTNRRKLVISELKLLDGRYSIDFEDFERKVAENDVKLFILCNPHNPVGRVWTRDELTALGDICLRHAVTVVSDEIHEDFVYEGHRHLVFSDLKPEYAQITVTCTSPAKTFNLAGLQIANIFISNPELMRAYKAEIERSGYSQPNVMGLTACKAAYTFGDEWVDELNAYIKGNINYLRDFLKERLPQVSLIEPEGTYLAWLDFNRLKLDEEGLEELIVNKAGLWLDRGTMFGKSGKGFQRVNIACPKSLLETALTKLEAAVLSL